MPTWFKVAIDAWTIRAVIADGHIFRPVHRGDELHADRLSEKVIWQLLRPKTKTMTNRKSACGQSTEISVVLGIECHVDTVVTHCDGTRVWLKDAFLPTGQRIGVTVCCQEATPCAWHVVLGRIGGRGRQQRRPD